MRLGFHMFSSREPRALCRFLLLATGFLSGCSSSFVTPSAPSRIGEISGTVIGGQQPVSGARIQLYAVGTSGDASAAKPLIAVTPYTDANGNFSITGLYKCPTSSSLVYLVASGGNPGLTVGTNNAAINLMAALGACSSLSASTYISVNEITTVAAVAALDTLCLVGNIDRVGQRGRRQDFRRLHAGLGVCEHGKRFHSRQRRPRW